jgi:hypothetical protein
MKIKILAEGDSWLKYPRKGILFGKDSNIVHHLKDVVDVNGKRRFDVKNMASNGDEVVDMLSGESRTDLIEELKNEPYKILLFSGGGNDIVGEHDFEFFIRPYRKNTAFQNLIHQGRYKRRIGQMMDAYRDLVDIAVQCSTHEETNVVTHTYELATPSAVGAEFFGIKFGQSWMYPYFKEKKYPLDDAGFKIGNQISIFLLTEFKNALIALEDELKEVYPKKRFFVVDTHNTLTEYCWRNEIHPNSKGFGIITKKIVLEGIAPALL